MTDWNPLLLRIAQGDSAAFAQWMKAAELPLRLGLKRFARTVDTEAVLQETLLRVWQVAPRFEPDGRPDGLLRLGHRIARNLAISETRRARTDSVDPKVLADHPDVDLQVDHTRPDPHLRATIEDCRDALPARPAQALSARLSARGGRSDAELANELGMKTNTFLQNVTRARKLLLDCLERHGVDLAQELA